MPEISLNLEKTEYKDINTPFKDDTLPPEEIKEIIMEGKKRTRRERYENCTEQLDIPFFEELEKYELLTCKDITSSNGKGSKNYTGRFVWNTQGLNEIPLVQGINKETLIQFLNPKKDITHDEAEDLLNSGANTLVASMTLLSNNYNWATTKLRTKVYERQFKNGFKYLKNPRYHLLNHEEVIFLTGRTLLVELNKVYENPYVDQLITKTDGLIHNFNRGLIGKIAGRFINKGIPTKDLFSAGSEGLLRGLKKYDIDTGNKFSTYAYWWIQQSVGRYVANNSSQIRHPVHMHNAINRFLRARNLLQKEKRDHVSFEEIIAYCEENNMKLTSNKKFLLKAYQQRNMESLDRELDRESDNSSTIADYVPDYSLNPEEIAVELETPESVESLIKAGGLTKREERMIKFRFGLISKKENMGTGHTLGEIGDMEGISRERVRQILGVAMRKLREAPNKDNFL